MFAHTYWLETVCTVPPSRVPMSAPPTVTPTVTWVAVLDLKPNRSPEHAGVITHCVPDTHYPSRTTGVSWFTVGLLIRILLTGVYSEVRLKMGRFAVYFPTASIGTAMSLLGGRTQSVAVPCPFHSARALSAFLPVFLHAGWIVRITVHFAFAAEATRDTLI